MGIDAPRTGRDAVVVNACNTLYFSAEDRLNSDPDDWPRGNGWLDEIRRIGGQIKYTGFGMEAAGTCTVTPGDPVRPGELPLTTLPCIGEVQELVAPDRCHVFGNDGAQVDEGACIRASHVTSDGGLLDSHLWPSRTRTSLRNDGGAMGRNGSPGTPWYRMRIDYPLGAPFNIFSMVMPSAVMPIR